MKQKADFISSEFNQYNPYAAHAFRKTLLVIFLYARMYVMLYIVGKSRPRTAGHNFDF